MQVNKNTSEKSKKMTPKRRAKRFQPYPQPEIIPKPKPKAKSKSKKGKEKPPEQTSSKVSTISSKSHRSTIASSKSQGSPSNLFTPVETEFNNIFDQNQNGDTNSMSIDENNDYIHPTQMEHINKISELLKREPKLKNEIKNIIVNQFVKAKIKPEQYEAIKQNIDALEVPEATHKAKKAKPRGKKSKLDNNVNKVIEEIVKQSVPKPRGKKSKTIKSIMNVDAPAITDEKLLKPVKEKYKQKKKVIRLD